MKKYLPIVLALVAGVALSNRIRALPGGSMIPSL